ncbi:MAG: SDR family oxidoreductase [Ardenticatenaceae bacterium]|nr:SDR family oxidoreductase [Ardenticatenaceae bacterium]MCB8947229.1 SDR family oxidoreductase [Ardenticatenaceae bacterium]
MKYVVVTGASTGIGYDAARYLIERGFHVFGSVRKQVDADRVQGELGEQFTPLLFDVTDEEAVATAVSQVAEIVGDTGLAGLVNNAGIAVAGPLMYLSLDEMRWQMEVNLLGQLSVTQKFLPLLGAVPNAPHPPGRIVNISSVSGKVVYPFMGPYAASKHALEAMSDALRRELLMFGIDVIVIGPGSVQTPIWDKAQDIDVEPYRETPYLGMMEGMKKTLVRQGKSGIPVEKVSEVIYEALTKEKPKTRYAIARKLLSGWLLPRYLPARMFDNIVAKRLGLTK